MPYASLADFLEELSAQGELLRVSAEVDGALEIAEITRRVAQQHGPALLFDRVRGASLAVVTNLLGEEHRVCQALGIDALDQIVERTESLIEKNTPHNWFDRLKMSGDEAGANKFRPKTVKSGPCQQVVRLGRDVDLAALPLVRQWPAETGPSITAGQLISVGPAGEPRGVTIRPLVAVDSNRLAVADDGHSAFARDWEAFRAAGEKMPVAIVLGGDPAGIIAAQVDTLPGADAYHVTGLVRGKALDVVKCRTHGLEVPAEADLVFEGYVDPEVAPLAVEAAGAGQGYYRAAVPAPLVHVTAITHRSHPIFPVIVGGHEGEHGPLVKVRERMLLPALRAIVPELVDLHLPAFGGQHDYAFVAMRKRYPFHARQIAAALWGSTALGFTKFLILMDAEVNVHDVPRVLAEVGANVAPECDIFAHDGPAHTASHANSLGLLSRHVAIDATAKIAGERTGASPAPLVVDDETRQRVTSRWAEYKLEVGRRAR